MNIHLPNDLKTSLQAALDDGRFASADDLVAQAVREYLRKHEAASAKPGPGLIGALRDDAELLDQAVARAMRVRDERPWRLSSDE